MNQWTPAAEGAGFELKPILQPLEPFANRLNDRQRPELTAAYVGERPRPRITPARRTCWLSVRAAGASGRRRRRRRTRSRRAAHRPGHAAAVARARRPTSRAAEAVRSNYVSGDADDAAADGDQPARRVRAPVRRRQHAGGARGASAAAVEPARLGRGRGRSAAERAAGRRTARASTTISTDVREIERRLAARRGLAARRRSTCPTRRSASRPISRSTRS